MCIRDRLRSIFSTPNLYEVERYAKKNPKASIENNLLREICDEEPVNVKIMNPENSIPPIHGKMNLIFKNFFLEFFRRKYKPQTQTTVPIRLKKVENMAREILIVTI